MALHPAVISKYFGQANDAILIVWSHNLSLLIMDTYSNPPNNVELLQSIMKTCNFRLYIIILLTEFGADIYINFVGLVGVSSSEYICVN